MLEPVKRISYSCSNTISDTAGYNSAGSCMLGTPVEFAEPAERVEQFERRAQVQLPLVQLA